MTFIYDRDGLKFCVEKTNQKMRNRRNSQRKAERVYSHRNYENNLAISLTNNSGFRIPNSCGTNERRSVIYQTSLFSIFIISINKIQF